MSRVRVLCGPKKIRKSEPQLIKKLYICGLKDFWRISMLNRIGLNALKILLLCMVFPLLTGCGEYQRVLKSKDPDEKFEFAKRAFEQGNFSQSYTLLNDVVTMLKGSEKGDRKSVV